MPKESYKIVTERMLDLIDRLKASGRIKYRQDFLNAIDLKKQNYRAITEGKAYFTVDHVYNASTTYKINANWLLGTESKIYR